MIFIFKVILGGSGHLCLHGTCIAHLHATVHDLRLPVICYGKGGQPWCLYMQYRICSRQSCTNAPKGEIRLSEVNSEPKIT